MPLARDINGQFVQALTVVTPQRVSVGAASAQSAVFGATTRVVRVAASTDCHIAFGTNPTATTTSTYLPAGAVDYFAVEAGQRAAVIRATVDGFVSVVECN